jgi:hypothetical protein
MEAVFPLDVGTYQITWHHSPEDCNPHFHYREDLKSHIHSKMLYYVTETLADFTEVNII